MIYSRGVSGARKSRPNNSLRHPPVDTGRVAVSSNGAGTYFASGSILKPIAQTGIGKVVGGIFGAVSAAKGVFDVALYFDALVVCSQDPTLQ